jgi:hypothetical protein
MLPPSLLLFVFASVIENGVGTGWTLYMDRELLWGDSEAIKLFSMRELLQVFNYLIVTHAIDYSCLIWTKIPITYVKMSIVRGQYAWVDGKCYSTHQRLNKEYLNKNNNNWFEQWLVGMTDGDGTFCIVRQNGKWNLAYKITQSRYNLRVLYYIKKQLGVGSVTKDNTKGQFFIRDRKKLETVIFPIFDKYPLLTSKFFNYLKFKQAFYILENASLTKDEKDQKLFALKDQPIPENYISATRVLPTGKTPSWNNANLPLKSINDINNVMTKPWRPLPSVEGEGTENCISPAISHLSDRSSYEEIESTISIGWLVGFMEARCDCALFLVSPSELRSLAGEFDIGFCITHKTDKFLLQLLKRLLHIPNNVKHDSIMNTYVLNTKNSRSILNIVNLFARKFKGMRSLEFKLWSRANFYKVHKKVHKVSKIHSILLKLHKKAQA